LIIDQSQNCDPILVVCPGCHPISLTESFLDRSKLGQHRGLLVFPSQKYSPYSAKAVFDFLRQSLGQPRQSHPLLLIGFSAGVVGAMGGAIAWELAGGKIQALIALDGWGVPAIGNFSVHRLSHDYFTHWSSALLGRGDDSFYAEPQVEHLAMWQSPDTITGWWETGLGCRIRCTYLEFLNHLCR
jgi:hypothetical protein